MAATVYITPSVSLLAIKDYSTKDFKMVAVPLAYQGNGNYRGVELIPGFGRRYERVTLMIDNVSLDKSGNGMTYHYQAEVLPVTRLSDPGGGPYAYRGDTALDNQNNLHVTWMQGSWATNLFSVFHRRLANGIWGPITSPYSSDTDMPHKPSIAVDNVGNAHVMWAGLDSDNVYYSVWDGLGWTEPITIGVASYWETDIAAGHVTDTLHLHVVWINEVDYQTHPVYYREWVEGAGWQDVREITGGAGNNRAYRVKVEADSQGDPHVVWGGGPGEIFHRERSEGVWQGVENVTFDLDTAAPVDPALAIDSQDRVYIIWSAPQYTGNIYYRKRDASGWSEVEMVFDGVKGCQFPALDIDSTGQVHAVWYEGDHFSPPPVYLLYAVRTVSGWSRPFRLAEMITDSVGGVGPDGVRVVVENGVVQVVYQNSEDYNLYHIRM